MVVALDISVPNAESHNPEYFTLAHENNSAT
jgi:hypothetical protein